MTSITERTFNRAGRRRRGMSLVELMIAGLIGSGVTFSMVSISTIIAREHKGIFSQQFSVHEAKSAIETINREIRLATTPLLVVDGTGAAVQQGNRVEFQRLNDTVVRAFELQAGADGDIALPWDNRLIYDPDTSIDGDEIEVARGIGPVEPAGAFTYSGATTPLVVRMRTGDPVGDLTEEQEVQSRANTGRGTQGMEINITVGPRN